MSDAERIKELSESLGKVRKQRDEANELLLRAQIKNEKLRDGIRFLKGSIAVLSAIGGGE